MADDLGLLVWSIHAPDLGSVMSPDPAERQRQKEILRRCLDLAEQLGAKAIPSHALLLGPWEQDPAGCEERIAEFLAELAETAEPRPAQIALENPGYAAVPAASSRRILARLNEVSRAAYGFVLDSGHAHLDGDLGEIQESVGDHLISLHLNDNDGRGDLHLAPGEGSVDWAKVREIIRGSGYRGVLMYEVERGEDDPSRRLAATLAGHRKLWGNPPAQKLTT